MPTPSLFRPALWLLCALWVAPIAHAAPCETSSDCPSRFACVTIGQSGAQPIKACRSQGCYRSSDCPEDMVCAQDAERTSCAPPYLLRCTRASDCGEGFDCVSPGEDCAEDAGTSCTGNRRCTLQKTACETAADCPTHFTCAASDSCDADAGSCPRQCLPPYAATDFALSGELRSLSGHRSHFNGRGYHHHDEGWNCSVTRPGHPAGALPVVFGLLLWGMRRRRAR